MRLNNNQAIGKPESKNPTMGASKTGTGEITHKKMPAPKNAMEVFQLLDKSNCRECGEKTCLAFAGAVFQGHRKISECPKLSPAVIERFSGDPTDLNAIEENREAFMEMMKQKISGIDLASAAARTGEGRRAVPSARCRTSSCSCVPTRATPTPGVRGGVEASGLFNLARDLKGVTGFESMIWIGHLYPYQAAMVLGGVLLAIAALLRLLLRISDGALPE